MDLTPNFLVIGDLKAGTSSLHSYLGQHPEIFLPEEKELRYFAFDPDNPHHTQARWARARTFEEYLGYFSAARGATAIGEASPNYLRSPGAADRIKAELPEAKLIVSLRNPAERLYSLHMMHRRSNSTRLAFEQRAFAENAAWIKGNFYWPDLSRYFELFSRPQIKVILFEDLVANPVATTRMLCRFLEVDDDFTPVVRIHNAGGIPRNAWAYSKLLACRKLAKRLVRPTDSMSRWWQAINRAALQRSAMDSKTRERILDVCGDDIRRTEELVGLDLSSWRRSEKRAAPRRASPEAEPMSGSGRRQA